jgi:hypothetical protein
MNLRFFKEQWDRALACLAAVLGVIALVLGWFGASGASLTVEQIPYVVSGAVAGLFALGTAATLWLSADLRDEWAKLDEINEGLHRAIDLQLGADGHHDDTVEGPLPAEPAAPGRSRRRLRADDLSAATRD